MDLFSEGMALIPIPIEDGDLAMLRYTQAGGGARLALLLHHDDAAREVAYDRELESFPSTADDTDRVLQSMTVSDALRELSQSHREILIETYFRGRTVPEAAEKLNLPLGTAKSRVYYALRALRTALQQRGVTE